jgi:phosphatidylserine/phosphatidylglycerophosphate/cardiolipin synthase-like enzyme
MNGEQFIKTMIETIKYDDYNNKEELLGILRYSIITFRETGTFGNLNQHYREYIELRVPIPMLKKAKKYKDIFEDLARDIYLPNSDFEFWGLEVKPRIIEMEEDNPAEHDVIFNEIKDTIIQGIRNAKYTIWIAVAWLTEEEIFSELLAKKKKGIYIRIITSNENSNMKLMSQLEENFDVIKAPLKGKYLSNRMHDKFCIIDFEFVMHGSFNWSKNAQYNDETLATALDKDFVKKFADEFMRLVRENSGSDFDW